MHSRPAELDALVPWIVGTTAGTLRSFVPDVGQGRLDPDPVAGRNPQGPAAGSVTIASGTATADITWKSDNVWNNDGDTAYLYDGSGRLVSQKKG